ncbi:MAG: ATPase, T2SS/T4P/T4SS family [Thermodesulfobacteriota bacterium]
MAGKKIGELLVESGLITEAQLQEALEESKKQSGMRIGNILVKKGYAKEIDISQTLSFQLSIPFVDLSAVAIDPEAIKLVSEKLARKYLLIPLFLDSKALVVAMSDPLNLNAIDDVSFSAGLQVKPCVATTTDIAEAIRLHYHISQPIENLLVDLKVKADRPVEVLEEIDTERDLAEQVKKSSAPPIIKIVDSIIIHGVENKASDIHLEPQEKWVKVRMRVDGLMREAMQLPKWVQGAVTSRIKLMAKMDIVERRISQDGRIKVRLGDKYLDLRISTLPTQYGEKVVMRILDPKAAMINLDSIGLSNQSMEWVVDMITRPQGVVLVTGPTGCGKTSTLYAMIERIKREEINIITIEDPIEYELKGVNQVQINEKTGLSFSYTLRSVLRQDPDVILVGEMRDSETALIAFQASITGHLVFSTLHTNDAVSTVIRLKNLGLPSYLIASSLNGIIAQRLVRKICPQCKEPYAPPEDELKRLGLSLEEQKLYRGKGCKNCGETGFAGRTGIFEILNVNNKIRDLIAQDAPEQEITKAAVESGMISMYMDGLKKVLFGLTTIEELNRVVYFSGEEKDLWGICPTRLQAISPESETCPHCQRIIVDSCSSCGKKRESGWIICPYCATVFEAPKSNLAKSQSLT